MTIRAIRDVTLIDCTGRDPVRNAAVLIEGGRIAAVGPERSVHIPADAISTSGEGYTLLPGLIDCHVHIMIGGVDMLYRVSTPPSFRMLQCVPHLLATLHAGITTIRDAWGATLGVKMAVERGIIPGPRMQISVVMLSQTGGHGDSFTRGCIHVPLICSSPEMPDGIVDGVDAVRQRTREILRAGADWIKLCTTGGVLSQTDEPSAVQFTVEEIETAVYEARAAGGKYCMAHAQGTEGIKNAIRAGVKSIEHGVYLDDEAIEMMKQRDVFLVPTLVAPMQIIRQAEGDPGSMPPWAVAKTREVLQDHMASFRQAVSSGVQVAMGTDSGLGPHGDNAEEISIMAHNGMSPMNAIMAATCKAAELLRISDQIGTVEPGKLADMILVDGDPLEDITILAHRDRVVTVMKDGLIYKDLRPGEGHLSASDIFGLSAMVPAGRSGHT